MRRIREGWGLTKKSWRLVRGHRELFRFPVLAGLSVLAVVLIAIVPGLYLIDDGGQPVLGVVLAAVGLYVAVFVGVFFAVGLAAAADAVFHGRPATLRGGLGVARSRIVAVAGWALLSSIVGAILAVLENVLDSARAGGWVLGWLGGVTWSLITFLAVPVIAVEGTGPIATLRRTASIFRERWKSQLTGNVSVGGIVLLIGLVPAIALIIGGAVIWASGGEADIAIGAVIVALGIVVLVLSLVIHYAVQGVFGLSLYRYATDGETVGDFTAAELESAAGGACT